MKLIVFDMDGMIFKHCNFWVELHKAFGTWEKGKELTKLYLNTNYELLVKEVIGKLWKGKDASEYFQLIKEQEYLPGVYEVMRELKKRGYKIGIISSGPKDLALRAKEELGIDYIYANSLEIVDSRVTGSTDMKNWPIRSGNKAEALRELCRVNKIDYKDVIVVVHDDNDISMAKTAGFAIAFNPLSEELVKYCNKVIVGNDLREILPILNR